MEEKLLYVEILKNIINRYYEKEMVFYYNGKWYFKKHCRNMSTKELMDWIFKITSLEERNCNEFCIQDFCLHNKNNLCTFKSDIEDTGINCVDIKIPF